MGFMTFTIAVLVALPRQLVAVYFGYALASKDAAGRTCIFLSCSSAISEVTLMS
jgi:hypothetical protein